jgi:hypothetical protein
MAPGFKLRRILSTTITLAFLLSSCGTPPAPELERKAPDTLPNGLTDREFWKVISDFSEADGQFQSDNFVSNESGYQQTIPTVLKAVKPGGVYIGVGPEQNFTYITAFQPNLAFIIDIRRQNMLEHLFYKALMETSADRVEFLSRLLARSAVALTPNPTPAALFRAYRSARPVRSNFEMNVRKVVEYLERQKGFKLSKDDKAGIRYVAEAFFKSGPDLSYTTTGDDDVSRMPYYSDLMCETDGTSRNWSFLATEEQFHAVQRMQRANLIVPLVGDFAGPKSIRLVGEYVQAHGSTVRVFYTSNVEEYLFQDDRQWKQFYRNVASLPIDSTSVFIRSVLNGWKSESHRTSFTAPIEYTIRSYRNGGIRTYFDVVLRSR